MRERWLLMTAWLWLGATGACEDKFQTASKGDPSVGGQSEGSGGSDMSAAGDSIGGAGGDPRGAGEGGLETSAGTANDSGAGGEGGAASPHPSSCQSLANCAAGENCVANRCVPALVSCAAQKNSYPTSRDGVY